MDTKPLLIRLTDDERAALERLRVESGARSWAEVIRTLIAGGFPPKAQAVKKPDQPAPFKSRLKGDWKAP